MMRNGVLSMSKKADRTLLTWDILKMKLKQLIYDSTSASILQKRSHVFIWIVPLAVDTLLLDFFLFESNLENEIETVNLAQPDQFTRVNTCFYKIDVWYKFFPMVPTKGTAQKKRTRNRQSKKKILYSTPLVQCIVSNFIHHIDSTIYMRYRILIWILYFFNIQLCVTSYHEVFYSLSHCFQ